jgi:hypothetical protein
MYITVHKMAGPVLRIQELWSAYRIPVVRMTTLFIYYTYVRLGTAHSIDLVPPKRMVVEGAPYLASNLLGRELLHVLPCA